MAQTRSTRRTSPPAAKSLLRRTIAALLPAGLLAACLLGIIIRLSVKDRLVGCNAYYYATPPAVLAGLASLAAAWWLLRRRWILGLPTLALGLACLGWSYRTIWHHNPPGSPGPGPTVLFWNVARGAAGWPSIAGEIRRYDVDVVGLVEAGLDVPQMQAFWRARLPDYEAAVFKSGITLLARGKITVHDASSLGIWGWYAHCEVRIDQESLHVVVIDMKANPLRLRRRPFRLLYQLFETLPNEPLLVLGDFNTPTDSVFVQPFHRYFANAFELAGNGCAATWPVPLPVLTIDQAWFNEGLLVDRCQLGWSWLSDHRPIKLEVTVHP